MILSLVIYQVIFPVIQLGGWMTNLGSMLTNQISSLLISSLQPSLVITSHHVRNLCVTFDNDFNFRKHISLTCCPWFYHIYNIRRIRHYIFLSVAKPLLQHSLLVAVCDINARLGPVSEYCRIRSV